MEGPSFEGGPLHSRLLRPGRAVQPLQSGSITVSPVWLPYGLSLATVLIFGPRFWPAVALAVMAGALSIGLPVPTAIGLGFAKAAEVLLAVYLMRGPGRFTGTLDSVRNVLALVIGGAVLASIPGAFLAVTCLSVSGLAPWSRFAELASTWWLGDAMGVLIVAPVVLAFVTPRRWSFDKNAVTTLVIIASTLFVACELAFGRLLPPASPCRSPTFPSL